MSEKIKIICLDESPFFSRESLTATEKKVVEEYNKTRKKKLLRFVYKQDGAEK